MSEQTNTPVDNSTATTTDGGNTITQNPFGLVDNPLDDISFDLNEDGEMEISGFETSEETTQKETATKEVKETPATTKVDNPFETEQRSKDNSELKNKIKELEDKLSAVDTRIKTDDATKQSQIKLQERRKKLEDAGFQDEQIDAILEITAGTSTEEEVKQEEKVDDTPSDLQVAKEVNEVLSIYNGSNGTPSVEQMRPHVDYIYKRVPGIEKYPMKTAFRLAENAVFIQYLNEKYPTEMKTLDPTQTFTVSENLRKLWYKQEGGDPSSFNHILGTIKKESTTTTNKGGNTTVSNDDVKRLMGENRERSVNVPGGEVETAEEIRERNRPRSAREIAELSVAAAFND